MTLHITAAETLLKLDIRRTHIEIRAFSDGHAIANATVKEATRALVNDPQLYKGCVDRKGYLRHIQTAASTKKVLRSLCRQKVQNDSVPGAEDNNTVYRDGQTFSHHGPHCTAFGRGLPSLNSHCL